MRETLSAGLGQSVPEAVVVVCAGLWTVLGLIGLWTLVRTTDNAVNQPRQPATDGGVDARAGGVDSGIEMVVAYIRPDKLGDVKRGLAEASTPSITVSSVSGRGSQPPKKSQWRGEEYSVDLHRRVKVECVVADIPTEQVVDAIADTAYTGEPGDGKIFVLPVRDARQIRTGDRGPEAV